LTNDLDIFGEKKCGNEREREEDGRKEAARILKFFSHSCLKYSLSFSLPPTQIE
jgi:hypothetical protein